MVMNLLVMNVLDVLDCNASESYEYILVMLVNHMTGNVLVMYIAFPP